MVKVKFEKLIIISLIGLSAIVLVGLGGNIALKAGLPARESKPEVDFEKRLLILENDMASGVISQHQFDSLTDLLRIQKKRQVALQYESQNVVKMPAWLTQLGVIEPEGLKFDPVFSSFTYKEDPTEGFNSVSLVYTGSYESAVAEANRIAAQANLTKSKNLIAIGSPSRKENKAAKQRVIFMNYDLESADQDFLISVEVEPSGRLTLMATDNKQLNERLLTYEPLNNRFNGASKQKKQ